MSMNKNDSIGAVAEQKHEPKSGVQIEFEAHHSSWYTIHAPNGHKSGDDDDKWIVLHLNNDDDCPLYVNIKAKGWYLHVNNTEEKTRTSFNRAIKQFGPIYAQGLIRDQGDDDYLWPLDHTAAQFRVKIPHSTVTKQKTQDDGQYWFNKVFDRGTEVFVHQLFAEVAKAKCENVD